MTRISLELLNTVDQLPTITEKLNILKPELNYELNDREYSRLFSEVVHARLRYNITVKEWMYYNGKYWEYDVGNIHAKRAMKEFSRSLAMYTNTLDPESDKDMISFISDLGKASRRVALIKDAYDEYTVRDEDFDNNNLLFNCSNCTIDLANGETHPHTSSDMITKISPVNYDRNVSSPILDNFMNEVFENDQALIDYVYRVLGYSLTGLTKEECFFILLGESTRNGKSTLMSMFSYLLGGDSDSGYMKDINIETLAQRKYLDGSSPKPDIAKLKGSRMVTCSEPPEDFSMDEAKLKTMTGGDRITARLLRKNEVSFYPTFKIFMATNHRPLIQDDSLLESHRIRVIPFNRHFSEDEQDKSLKDILKSSEVQSALLNKCLFGYASYINIGLREPSAVIDATSKYKTAREILELFMSDSLIKSPDGLMKMRAFYELYVEWCESRGIIPQPKRKILSSLRVKGIIRDHATINGVSFHNVVKGYCEKTVAESVITAVPVTQAKTAYVEPKPIPIPDVPLTNHIQQNSLVTESPSQPTEEVPVMSGFKDVFDQFDHLLNVN